MPIRPMHLDPLRRLFENSVEREKVKKVRNKKRVKAM